VGAVYQQFAGRNGKSLDIDGPTHLTLILFLCRLLVHTRSDCSCGDWLLAVLERVEVRSPPRGRAPEHISAVQGAQSVRTCLLSPSCSLVLIVSTVRLFSVLPHRLFRPSSLASCSLSLVSRLSSLACCLRFILLFSCPSSLVSCFLSLDSCFPLVSKRQVHTEPLLCTVMMTNPSLGLWPQAPKCPVKISRMVGLWLCRGME
jgi:hypothetical protein